jgi:uncharacterized membrane protein
VFFFILITQPLSALAQTQPTAPQPPSWYGPGWMWGDGNGWQYWWICPLMMLFMFVIVGAICFFVRRSRDDGPQRWELPWRGPDHAALQILNERFARGEIKQDEYEEKRISIISGGLH